MHVHHHLVFGIDNQIFRFLFLHIMSGVIRQEFVTKPAMSIKLDNKESFHHKTSVGSLCVCTVMNCPCWVEIIL